MLYSGRVLEVATQVNELRDGGEHAKARAELALHCQEDQGRVAQCGRALAARAVDIELGVLLYTQDDSALWHRRGAA